jgi:hypothetical protein
VLDILLVVAVELEMLTDQLQQLLQLEQVEQVEVVLEEYLTMEAILDLLKIDRL